MTVKALKQPMTARWPPLHAQEPAIPYCSYCKHHVLIDAPFLQSRVMASPSPSPVPQPATLSLISSLPGGYAQSGAGGNLSAAGAYTCVKDPSPVEGVDASITSPGSGLCSDGTGTTPLGMYSLSQMAPAGLYFVGWQCYYIVNGVAGPAVDAGAVTLNGGDMVTCVAQYVATPTDPPTCGDVNTAKPGNQMFDCAAVNADWEFNANETDSTNVVPTTCCKPKYTSCLDTNPSKDGCQPWVCNNAGGWYVNEDAYFVANPSDDRCCLVSLHRGLAAVGLRPLDWDRHSSSSATAPALLR